MRLLKSLWLKVIDRQVLQVYHHDSPGIRVFVRRNRFQRLLYNRTFSGVGEQQFHTLADAFPEYVGSPQLLKASITAVSEFNQWLVESQKGRK